MSNLEIGVIILVVVFVIVLCRLTRKLPTIKKANKDIDKVMFDVLLESKDKLFGLANVDSKNGGCFYGSFKENCNRVVKKLKETQDSKIYSLKYSGGEYIGNEIKHESE